MPVASLGVFGQLYALLCMQLVKILPFSCFRFIYLSLFSVKYLRDSILYFDHLLDLSKFRPLGCVGVGKFCFISTSIVFFPVSRGWPLFLLPLCSSHSAVLYIPIMVFPEHNPKPPISTLLYCCGYVPLACLLIEVLIWQPDSLLLSLWITLQHCQCLHVNQKKFCSSRKFLRVSLSLQCYAGLASSSFIL